MNSNREISHRGRVLSVTPECTSVEIISESACASCHAKGLCSMSESKSKIVDVGSSAWLNLAPGDEVMVTLKASMGHKVVWLAYVLPLVVLMTVLAGMTGFGISELYSGLFAIGAVALYYFVIWLLRNRLRNEYVFDIKLL